jgi:Domain of unknown function (DUF2760)
MDDFWKRVTFAFRCFFSILLHGIIPEDIARELMRPPVQAAASPAVTKVVELKKQEPESFDRAVQMLALLQRDGRLIDFLAEDVSPYPDAQLGAAVRSVHQSCRGVLDRYVRLEPIFDSEEDKPVNIQAGFDPGAIKLIGNVSGEPPLKGLLRHRGWRVREVDLPALPQGSGRMVVAPAEVEVP